MKSTKDRYRDKSVESPPIVDVFDVEKEDDSRDIEECIRRIDSLVEGDFISGQKVLAVEEEVDVAEKEVRVAVVNEKAVEENTEKKSVENILNAFEFMGGTTDNLE
ncbi:hypothetical protein PVK06_043485 [Gossypium arboreum]|uniref:Uncharacterized protein n=1 Tax=Gossypium arboreum TaxID=29729 RepID=A0ABR0MP12_GOSAR|nr:hypothetical protein PVK06_043485 [Gossypium arboreum]